MHTSDLPFFIRLGGFPLSCLQPFVSPHCSALIQEAILNDKELAQQRGEIVTVAKNLIGSTISLADERALLLQIKRDAFNGRSLNKHRSCLPPRFTLLSGGLEHALCLESRAEAIEKELVSTYKSDLAQQLIYVQQFLADSHRLRRIISFSSPDLLEALTPPTNEKLSRRQEKRLLALLRYMTRGALKPSPFSRLTRIGLCDFQPEEEIGQSVEISSEKHWTEISTVRIRRVFTDQVLSLLLKNLAFRREIAVAVNSSLESLGKGVFRLLKPISWFISKSGRLEPHPMTFATLRLQGALIERVLDICTDRFVPYGSLATALIFKPDEDFLNVDRQLVQLIDAGVLQVVYPWASDHVHLELKIASFLNRIVTKGETTQEASVLRRVGCLLEELGREEEHLCQDETAQARIRWVEEICADVFKELYSSISSAELLSEERSATRPQLFEDTFTMNMPPSGTTSLASISPNFTNLVFDLMTPLFTLIHVFSRRFELLHTLEGFFASRGTQGDVPLISVLHDTRGLWKEYFKSAASTHWKNLFNPFQLEPIKELHRIRENAWAAMVASDQASEDELFIDENVIQSLQVEIPSIYHPIIGPCLFVQMIDSRNCVINQIFDGTGRASTRYAAMLSVEHGATFRARAEVFSDFGEAGELLDVPFTKGEILNLHPIQTPKILSLPGEHFELPADRMVHLKDLVVRFSSPYGLPELRDSRTGRRYFPVHLGASNPDLMPSLIRFLLCFGPGQSFPTLSPIRGKGQGSMTVYPRLKMGCCVLSRKEWRIQISEIRQVVEGLDQGRALLAMNRWRDAHSIPERIFFRVLILPRSGSDLQDNRIFWKPQYVDLCSPALFENFLRIVRQVEIGTMTLTEILPDWTLKNGYGDEKYAFELQLDSLGAWDKFSYVQPERK